MAFAMTNLIVDERDQRFVLHEMLRIGELAKTPRYGHLAREDVDAALAAAVKLALRESYPIMVEADREGCRLEDGAVRVPRCYHRLKRHFDEGAWPSAHVPREAGGLGFPLSLWAATFEDFVHNFGFLWPWAGPLGPGFVLQFGSEEQKRRYLPNLVGQVGIDARGDGGSGGRRRHRAHRDDGDATARRLVPHPGGEAHRNER